MRNNFHIARACERTATAAAATVSCSSSIQISFNKKEEEPIIKRKKKRIIIIGAAGLRKEKRASPTNNDDTLCTQKTPSVRVVLYVRYSRDTPTMKRIRIGRRNNTKAIRNISPCPFVTT